MTLWERLLVWLHWRKTYPKSISVQISVR